MREKEAIENEVSSSDHDAAGEKFDKYQDRIEKYHVKKNDSSIKMHTDWADVCNNPDYVKDIERRMKAIEEMKEKATR